MTYVALRHVRFDRDYRVGEEIRDEAVDPGMACSLTNMGYISKILRDEKDGAKGAKNVKRRE